MKHCYWLKYNNYANRILKVSAQLSDYKGVNDANVIYHQEDMELWNPNDGISTTVKAGTVNNSANFSTEPDYFICTDGNGVIDSRWFVIENRRIRKGQYLCVLKRDVFADALPDLLNATCHIDRAILMNSDPLIFNPEPITVNQILHAEYPIKDQTQIPWIVFYSAEKLDAVSNYDPVKHYYDILTDDHAAWKASNEFTFFPNDIQSIQIQLQWETELETGRMPLITDALPYTISTVPAISLHTFGIPSITNPSAINREAALSAFKEQFGIKDQSEANQSMELDGKILYDSTDEKYYRVSVSATAASAIQAAVGVSNSETVEWAQEMVSECTDVGITPLAGNIITQFRYSSVQVTLTEIVQESAVDFRVPTDSCRPSDAPYYMWCMPYGKIEMEVTVGGTTKYVDADPTLNLSIASYIANKNTENKTFDVQILPYCPLPDEFIRGRRIVVNDDTQITDLGTIVQHTDSSNIRGFIFACPACTFTRQIIREFYPYFPSYKMSDICGKARLYSPNYSSSFEFSMARNNGCEGFNVRCTYMPINPYIRIAPIWGGLYGSPDFGKDPRGLICSGNYSIARLNDQWVAYQEQNKNFEAIFNREIEHMDVQRKYERAGQIAGAIAGTVTGAAAGAAAGKFIPGIGSIAGGITGGIGAALTGAADVAHAEKLFQESKSYATDLHYLQLGNVQALPRSLAKTTAFNVDNRYFPILATYLPTEREIELVDEYINIHSMNVDAMGKPADYIHNRYCKAGTTFTDRGFISGSIVRIETTFDTHFIDELNKEFQMGVYMR